MKTQAKDLVKLNKKNRALLLLKLMKLKEAKVDEIDKQLLTVVEMIEKIEWESQNVDILNALAAGTKALNALHKEFTVERVEELLEDSREAVEVILFRYYTILAILSCFIFILIF